MPPSGNENGVEDEMVRGKSSGPSDNEDQVNLEMNQFVKIQQKRSDNYFQIFQMMQKKKPLPAPEDEYGENKGEDEGDENEEEDEDEEEMLKRAIAMSLEEQ